MLIAIPSDAPGGLDAPVAAHFGHCHAFTLVEVDKDQIGEVTVMENGGHEHGGCMAPVQLLKGKDVEVLLAGGMGARPLSGFGQVGINVHSTEGTETVRDAVQLFVAGKAPAFDQNQTCGGGGGGCGGHGHDHGHDHGHAHGGHHHHAPVVREPIEGKVDVQEGRIVSFHYKLTEKGGAELDSSEGVEPLQYLHGHGNIVPGLEKAMVGLEVGEQKTVEVAASEAYGERDDSQIMDVPLDQLPENPEVGAVLHARQPDGRVVGLTVIEVGDTSAKLDLNHPLAGKDLVFDVTIAKIEKATEEEIAHGHPH